MPAPRRIRVLWVCDEAPDRSLGGGHIRQAHLIEALAQRADVTLLLSGEVRDPGVRAVLAGLVEVPDAAPWAPRRTTVRRCYDLWIAVRGPRPIVLTARRRRRMRGPLRRLEPQHDLVVASHLSMAVLQPHRPRRPWWTDLQHVPSVKAVHEQAVAPGARQRWLLEREEAHSRRCERAVVERAAGVVVVSEEDAALLGLEPGPRCVVVPNGADVRRYAPTPLPAAPNLVMTGSYQYSPNADGAVWFVDSVLPKVRAEVPEVTLALVGRAPLPEVVALAERPGIELFADVPDVAPHLAAARVALVPLRVGTGTRLKAVEAMAAGRPVVGTSIGLEGLGVVDGEHAEVADDPEEMAARIVRLLRDDGRAESVARAGRALVEERFDWRAIGSRFADAVLAAVPDPSVEPGR